MKKVVAEIGPGVIAIELLKVCARQFLFVILFFIPCFEVNC